MSNVVWNKNSNSVTVFVNGEVHTVPRDASNFGAVLDAIKMDDVDAVQSALDVMENIKTAVEAVVGDGVTITDDSVYVNGKKLHNVLSERILDFARDGLPVTPLVNFLKNLYKNPMLSLVKNPEVLSLLGLTVASAGDLTDKFIDDFYSFLSHRNLPLTEDGCFLAYKTVDSEYWSKASGSMKLVRGVSNDSGRVYNAPGEVIECKREDVDPNRFAECSYGLHVGCLEYSGPGGWYNNSSDKVVIVKVNPADVVAVPPDHNRTKMRTCAYEVLQDYVSPLKKAAYAAVNEDVYQEEEEDWFVDCDIDDVYIGNEIKFIYAKPDETKIRHILVTNIDFDRNGISKIHGTLLGDEPRVGEFGQFTADRISCVTVLDDDRSYEDDDDESYSTY
jgi:enamine deaminase RidA (YjgF/YER057c/UK114 family)